ncbi:EamA family transporter RarD [Tenggerimyces flavus]|uniref:EamA family transporter RarD n=1 Tax=Tenggerimyces flavus TaxID=1708749 RepID=A0ABV7Y870_9ACTN|nr:EamA family transporter RarD [Tenggerimyces flavus]MBM7791169.1 chloramphenicol-sensitive protein RarD [Tenggerimyces flavus]
MAGGQAMGEGQRGILFGVGAYAAWGLFPLYWTLLEPATAFEILAHRIVWSLVFVAGLLLVTRRNGWWTAMRARPRTVAYLAIAAVVIAVNWFVYIWAVNHGHVVQTSLGYYINPLVTVLLGVALLRERLNRTQWIAMAVAGAAVVLLTVDYGKPPWISFCLAISFAIYAVCKKKANAGAIESLTVETAVLMPVALGYIVFLHATSQATFGHQGIGKALLLMSAGVITAIPLLLFAGAATRTSMVTLGLLQYLAPTIQLVIGVALFHEPMPPTRLAGFAIVWLALAIFTWDGLARRRASRRAPAGPSSGTTPVVEQG